MAQYLVPIAINNVRCLICLFITVRIIFGKRGSINNDRVFCLVILALIKISESLIFVFRSALFNTFPHFSGCHLVKVTRLDGLFKRVLLIISLNAKTK